jgi:hypothetical protein
MAVSLHRVLMQAKFHATYLHGWTVFVEKILGGLIHFWNAMTFQFGGK